MADSLDNQGREGKDAPTPRSITYNELLERIFLASSCHKKCLYNSERTERSTDLLLNKAIKAGHVRIGRYKEKYGSRYRQQKYYSITSEGIAYLSGQSTKWWYQYLPRVSGHIVIFPLDRRARQIAYSTRCGNSMLFARDMGANISDFILSGEPSQFKRQQNKVTSPSVESEEEKSWWEGLERETDDWSISESSEDDSLCDAADAETLSCADQTESGARDVPKVLAQIKLALLENTKQATGHGVLSNSSDIYFFPAREMKKMLTQGGERDKAEVNFAYGQYTGVVAAPSMSVLLYHAHHDGIPWSENLEKKDIRILHRFSVRCSPYDNVWFDRIHGAVLVYNEKNFGDIIKNKFEKRTDRSQIGKSFTSMYLIPLSPFGQSLLFWILTESKKDRTLFAKQFVEQTCEAVETKDRFRNGFQFRTPDYYILDGTEMDFKRIFSAMTCLSKTPDLPFKILCFEWQEYFYRAVWPDAEMLFLT